MNRDAILQWIHQNVPASDFEGKKVLLIVPDSPPADSVSGIATVVGSRYRKAGSDGGPGHSSADAAAKNSSDVGNRRFRSL